MLIKYAASLVGFVGLVLALAKLDRNASKKTTKVRAPPPPPQLQKVVRDLTQIIQCVPWILEVRSSSRGSVHSIVLVCSAEGPADYLDSLKVLFGPTLQFGGLQITVKSLREIS